MSKTRIWITMVCCFFAVTALASAQTSVKPGLWEMTTNMTWQKSPMPPGITMPAGMKSPFSGTTTTTTQACLTQAMIDKNGAMVPPANGDCKMSNIVMRPSSMTADLVCTGKMNAKATLESSWAEGNIARGKMHFVGTMVSGQDSLPIEYTVEFKSVYKSADCGNVKPMPMPKN
jgi:hypothetical protein